MGNGLVLFPGAPTDPVDSRGTMVRACERYSSSACFCFTAVAWLLAMIFGSDGVPVLR